VLLGPLAGALADRLNRKFTMVVGDILRGLLFITIPVVENQTNYFAVTMLESNMESGYSLELPYAPPIVAPKFNRP